MTQKERKRTNKAKDMKGKERNYKHRDLTIEQTGNSTERPGKGKEKAKGTEQKSKGKTWHERKGKERIKRKRKDLRHNHKLQCPKSPNNTCTLKPSRAGFCVFGGMVLMLGMWVDLKKSA